MYFCIIRIISFILNQKTEINICLAEAYYSQYEWTSIITFCSKTFLLLVNCLPKFATEPIKTNGAKAHVYNILYLQPTKKPSQLLHSLTVLRNYDQKAIIFPPNRDCISYMKLSVLDHDKHLKSTFRMLQHEKCLIRSGTTNLYICYGECR